MREDYKTYDCFVGKIAPFLLFEMEYHSLFYVVETLKDDKFYSTVNPSSHIASIGLLAYFEAFCKHQFAAIVNIMPSLSHSFSKKREETKIELSTIASFNGDFEKNIGFILAEIYDFGTARNINSIFRDLLSITPFSKDEELIFNSTLYKRNLLVHHAGYYTLQYLKKNGIPAELHQKAFKDAVRIDTPDYHEISDFLFDMAIKITRTSVKALKEHPDFILIQKDAECVTPVEEMLRGLYDFIDIST